MEKKTIVLGNKTETPAQKEIIKMVLEILTPPKEDQYFDLSYSGLYVRHWVHHKPASKIDLIEAKDIHVIEINVMEAL